MRLRTRIGLIATTVLATVLFQTSNSHAQGGCELLGQVYSQGNQPAQLALRNDGSRPLYVFWIDYKGQESDYQYRDQPLASVGPGQTQTITASQGHYYSVYDENETCIGVIAVEQPAVQISFASGGPDNPSIGNAQGGTGEGGFRAAAPAAPSTDDTRSAQANAGGDIQRVLELVNAYRARGATCTGTGASFGPAPALQLHGALSQAAEAWSRQMLASGVFDHGNMAERIRAVCGQVAMGENIAGNPTPDGAVAGWMASTSGHCEAIMNPQYRLIGIGKAAGGQFGAYWTQKFADTCRQ